MNEPHEISDEVAPECPECVEGLGIELGTLGQDTWYRCRYCGYDWRV